MPPITDITEKQLQAEVEEVFFLLNLQGYAKEGAKAKKQTVPHLPDFKQVTFEHGRYTAVDMWWTVPHTAWSFGQTIISRDGDPVWFMHYSGHYTKDAIPFLKEALRQTYERHEFVRGRGPADYTKDGWTYRNNPNTILGLDVGSNNFHGFSGIETILSPKGFRGVHLFRGGMMTTPDWTMKNWG